jgi:hypothetical protein
MKILRTVLSILAASAFALPAQASPIAGCPVFPADNIWNQRVDGWSVHPRSNDYVASIGSTATVRVDGSTDPTTGIPFVTVPGTQPRVPVTFAITDESDPGPYPIPPDAPIQGGGSPDGDRRVIVLDRDNCKLYEMFNAVQSTDGVWQADEGAVFDLRSDSLRPAGFASTDPAGLPVLPGLLRFDEVTSGVIDHALRVTVRPVQNTYVWPARHEAGNSTSLTAPPFGLRFRLKAGFDISHFSQNTQVVLTALKRYGMLVADIGSLPWFLTAVPDSRWDPTLVNELRTVPGSQFEAVDSAPHELSPDSGATLNAPSPRVPALSTVSIALLGLVLFVAAVTRGHKRTVSS